MSFTYEEAEKRLGLPPVEEWGRTNGNPTGIGLFQLVCEDLRTHEHNLFEQGFWAIAVHRFGNWRMGVRWKVFRAPLTLLYLILYKFVEWFCGITLSYTVRLGRRVRIWHHGGMIIGARSIGDDVHLRQNTTLGVAQTWLTELPIICDRADIGCNVAVLGRVLVGTDAKIAANALVLDDVPDGATVMGNPAKVVFVQRPATASETSDSQVKVEPTAKQSARPRSPAVSRAAADAIPRDTSSQEASTRPMTPLGTLAILGSTNMDYLAMNFRDVAATYDAKLEIYVPPYGQAVQELLGDESASGLLQAAPETALIVERAEDLLGDLYHDPLGVSTDDRDAVLDGCLMPLTQVITLARERLSGRIFVLGLTVLHRSPLGQADPAHKQGLQALIRAANRKIAAVTEEMADVRMIDAEQVMAEVGRERAQPGKYWHLGRIPFSNELGAHLARRVLGGMLSLAGKTTRLLVLDLDNTLWGGILGEDGYENLKLGGAYPGSAFQGFQRAIKALSRRGIALAVASKNDEDLALQMIESHPEMILRKDDFVSLRINWNSKAQNLGEIFDEVGLGAGSCMFLDDNPVEREVVRRNFPEAVVPEMPVDPVELADWLLNLPHLDCLSLTASDLKRTEQYKKQSVISAAKRSFANIEDFYRDLNMSIRFESFSPDNQERILQLLVKTNQFNATTRRHNAATIKKMIEEDCVIRGIGVQDRHSGYELMGVIILRPNQKQMWIDSFLLSCRILGRTIERAVLAWAAEHARKQSFESLIGEIIETERNTPVRNVYEKHGFDPQGGGRFRLPMTRDVPMPDYFEVLP